jgi:hypothetical protein
MTVSDMTVSDMKALEDRFIKFTDKQKADFAAYIFGALSVTGTTNGQSILRDSMLRFEQKLRCEGGEK